MKVPVWLGVSTIMGSSIFVPGSTPDTWSDTSVLGSTPNTSVLGSIPDTLGSTSDTSVLGSTPDTLESTLL